MHLLLSKNRQLLATEDARQTVILTLVSDVASDFFALLQLDLQLQITHATASTQEDSVKLNKLRVVLNLQSGVLIARQTKRIGTCAEKRLQGFEIG